MKVEVEDGALHVEVDGDVGSPSVVLWNGARCTTRMWDRVTPKLVRVLRVVRFDVRERGTHPPPQTRVDTPSSSTRTTST